jgi:4-hydroxy-tetrahydrodipicolinate synthase
MFEGSYCALITPFLDNTFDEKKFREIVEWHIAEGTDGLVPCGTTGESPTLSHEEHRRVIEVCIEVSDRRRPVIAGAGSNSTAEAVSLAEHAMSAGADAVLVVTPYYNKPTQEGLYQHFKTVQDVGLPVIIYNIPSRSIVDMSVETMVRLAKLPNIVGVKDSSQDLTRPILTRLAISGDFSQLSGEDGTAVAFLAAGGNGCISVTANVAPRFCATMHRAWRDRDINSCMEIQNKLTPLHMALFCESSPGPIKYAASLLDICTPETRLPLTEIAESSKQRVRAAMIEVGLIN